MRQPLTLVTLLTVAAVSVSAQDVWVRIKSNKGATSRPSKTTNGTQSLDGVVTIAQCHDNLANATLSLPTAGDVNVQAGDIVEAITLGIGAQEYTCSNSEWQLTGVSASLYDISCQYNSSALSALSQSFNNLASNAIDSLSDDDILSSLGASLQGLGLAGRPLVRLGKVTAGNNGFTFDFRKSAGGVLNNQTAFATGQIAATQPAPVASYNVDWLRITMADGTTGGALAKEVFQVQTAGGIPLTQGLACSNGAKERVPFSAQYWFYETNVAPGTKAEETAQKQCEAPSTTDAKKQMIILTQAVEYGITDQLCTSIDDCTKQCLAKSDCVGFSLSDSDSQGYTKLQVFSAKLGYSPVFTSGIVRSITNKQYVSRQGVIDNCPSGQITSPDFLGCQLPTC